MGEPTRSAVRPRFLIDENLPGELTKRLIEAGYDAEHVYDLGLRGRSDVEVFGYAQHHERAILTCDVGLGNVYAYPPPHAGIVVVRLPERMAIGARIAAILDALISLGAQELRDASVVIEPGRVRIHRHSHGA